MVIEDEEIGEVVLINVIQIKGVARKFEPDVSSKDSAKTESSPRTYNGPEAEEIAKQRSKKNPPALKLSETGTICCALIENPCPFECI